MIDAPSSTREQGPVAEAGAGPGWKHSQAMAGFCKDNNIRRSMGRTGVCYDNAVAESFFATYKKELIHTRPWPDIKSVRTATFEWVATYYNRTRRHSTLDYLTPEEYELGYRTLDQIHELAA